MAEGFARRYGADVMKVLSAGLTPAPIVQPLTKKVMQDKNINIDDQFPKDLGEIDVSQVDLIVNISGSKLSTQMPIEVRDWSIEDPIAKTEPIYVEVRDQIEQQVMRLILDLRKNGNKASPNHPPTPLRVRFGRLARAPERPA